MATRHDTTTHTTQHTALYSTVTSNGFSGPVHMRNPNHPQWSTDLPETGHLRHIELLLRGLDIQITLTPPLSYEEFVPGVRVSGPIPLRPLFISLCFLRTVPTSQRRAALQYDPHGRTAVLQVSVHVRQHREQGKTTQWRARISSVGQFRQPQSLWLVVPRLTLVGI